MEPTGYKMEVRRITNTLPDALVAKLTRMGEDISAARRARRISQAEMAEKIGVSRKTISSLEQGDPKVGFGTYLQAAWVMGLEDRLLGAFSPEKDPVAQRQARMSLPERIRQPGSVEALMGDLDF